jgi:parvulin-like peptidyl-prolyl isomerase
LKVDGEAVPESTLVLYWAQREVFEIKDVEVQLKVASGLAEHLGEETAYLKEAQTAGLSVSIEEVNRAARKSAAEFRRFNFIQLLNQEKWTLPAFRQQLEKRLLIKHYFQAEKEKLPPVSKAEVRKYYDEKMVSQMKQEEARALHLLLDTQEEADYVRQQLVGKSAMPFEVAARRFSKSPEADKGGLLEWFSKGAMPKVFDVCFELERNQVSKVIASDYGFHLFKLLDRRQGEPSSFEEKKELIGKILRQAQEEQLVASKQAALRERNAIQLHPENLKKRLLELNAQVVFVSDEAADSPKEDNHVH